MCRGKHHLLPGLAHWEIGGVGCTLHDGPKPIGKAEGWRTSPGHHKNKGPSLRLGVVGLWTWFGEQHPTEDGVEGSLGRLLFVLHALHMDVLIFTNELETSLN